MDKKCVVSQTALTRHIQQIVENPLRLGLALIICFVLILVLPALLTREWGLLDFSKTDDIGDTIGGITTPFLEIITSDATHQQLRQASQVDSARYSLLPTIRVCSTSVQDKV